MNKLFRLTLLLSIIIVSIACSSLYAGNYLELENDDKRSSLQVAPVNFYFPENVYHFKVKEDIKAYYEELHAYLNENKGMKIYLTGYAYDGSKKDWNDRLSKYRANKVRDSLVDAGFSRKLIVIDSHGKSAPLAKDESEKEIAKNRRVEMRIK